MRLLALIIFWFPFSGLAAVLPPRDEPPARTHVLRIWGNPELRPVVERWREAYAASHPGLRIELNLSGSDVAMAGLYTGSADLVLIGREATAPEVKAFEWIYRNKPARVELLTGSANCPGHSPALVFYVHAENPLASLTLKQADALFGHELRRGGAQLIHAWGELGLTGKWADCPIHLYAPDMESGTGRFFREAVLDGSRHLQWDRLTEFTDSVSPGHSSHDAGQKILEALSADRFGLAVTGGVVATTPLRALALSVDSESKAVFATNGNVGSREYVLARPVFAYFNRPSGTSTDPVLADFLRFTLSDAGQKVTPDSDGYLPLSPERAREQVKCLD